MAKPTKTGGATFPLIDAKRSYRGLITTPLWRGQRHIQAWPRKRGKPRSETTLTQNAEFVRFVRAVNDMPADQRIAAMEIAKGTPYTWRDVLSRAITGQLVYIDGGTLVDIQNALDGLTDVPGSIIIRTADGWVGLPAGLETQVLAIASDLPAWVDRTDPAFATGLFNQALSPIPTQAGSGFTSARNASYNTPVVADGKTGIVITSGTNTVREGWYGIYKTAPTAGNKRVTALLAVGFNWTNAYCFGGIGYSDGTKLEMLQFTPRRDGSGQQLRVATYSGIQTVVANVFTVGPDSAAVVMLWVQLQDDGTNIKYRVSGDGATFTEIFSHTKAAGYLGSSGYSQIFFGVNPYSSNGSATLMSYEED